MTLCIAATADFGRAILTLSDTRFSLGFTSGETFNKASKVHQRWAVSIAGDDMSCASPVIEAVKEWVWDTSEASRKVVEQAFVAAAQDRLVKRIEASVLSPYNLTITEFTKTGFKDLGPEAFADLRQQISQVTLGCEFLVYGFDQRKRAHIFQVKERGLVDDHCRTGFWAIGSGDYAAISALAFHDYATTMDLSTATYLVCQAKFMAERADLGRQTRVGYMTHNGTVYSVNPEQIREIWANEGKPRIPPDLKSRLPPFTLLAGSEPSNARTTDDEPLPSAPYSDGFPEPDDEEL